MNAIELGPVVLSGERFAILPGLRASIVGSSWLASRIRPRLNPERSATPTNAAR